MNNYLEYAINQFIKSGREHAIENVPVNGHTSEEPAGNIVLNLQGDEKWRIDKTYAELNTMYIRGRLTGLVWHLEDESVIFVPLTSKSVFNEQNAFIFSTIITTESGSSFHSFIVTEDDVLTYITEEVGGGGVDTAFQVVGLTPGGEPDVSEPSTQIIYLTKDAGSTATDPYTEWIYTEDGNWEIIGDTSIDLSDYYTKEEIDSALSGKVDAVEGMGLSTNDYSNEDKDKLDNLPSGSELETELGEKVDKVPGKGLSENDYTTAEKEKLGSVATGAEVNVLESVKVDGTNLSIDAKSVNIPVAGGTTGAWVKGVVSGEDTARWDNWEVGVFPIIPSNIVVIGGREYPTVQIGNQIWIAENLDWKWTGLTIGSSSPSSTNQQANYFNYDESTYGVNGNKYGLMYNYPAVKYLVANTSTMLPEGWHVPTSTDWTTLATNPNVNSNSSNLKSKTGWNTGNGNNSTGFNAYPSGEGYATVMGQVYTYWSRELGTNCYYFSDSATILDKPLVFSLNTSNSIYTSGEREADCLYNIRLVKNLT